MSLFKDFFHKKRLSKNNSMEENELYHMDDEDPDLDEQEPQSQKVIDYGDETSNQDIEYEVVEREIQPAKIICPDCGGITLEGLEFCDKCGGELL